MESNPNLKDKAILEDFNKKYNTEISLDSQDIDAFSRQIGNEGLKILCFIHFMKAQKLILEDNNISDINILYDNNFGSSITALDLSSNKIISLEVLSKINFPLLTHLFLNNNLISLIDIFCSVNFPNLLELNLSSNKISSIDILIKTNLPNLKELNLSKNQINSIDVLSEVNFPKLKILDLDNNKIKSIDVFIRVNFPKLKELKIEKNNLESINMLDKILFPKLKYLSIGDDTLLDNVDNLKEVAFPALEDIFLYLNDKINRDSDKILNIIEHFETIGVNFNFISFDNEGDEGGVNDELNRGFDVGDGEGGSDKNNININNGNNKGNKVTIENFLNKENLLDCLLEDDDDDDN